MQERDKLITITLRMSLALQNLGLVVIKEESDFYDFFWFQLRRYWDQKAGNR